MFSLVRFSSSFCARQVNAAILPKVSFPFTVRWASQHRVVLLPEVPSDTHETNPILHRYSQGFPNLSQISERQCYFGLGKAILEFESAVVDLETKCEQGVTDFNDLFGTLEESKCQLESAMHLVNLMHITTDSLDRDRFTQLHKRAERAFSSRHGSKVIFQTLQKLKGEHIEKNHLSPEQVVLLERYLLEYKHQGFGLSERKYLELTTNWIVRLNEAKRDYNFKFTTATQRFSATVKDPNVVRDFPVDVLRAMAVDSSQPSKGPWTVSLHPYIYRKFMEFCPDRKMRWSVYNADVSRGSRKFDVYLSVASQLKDIRQHRSDQAITLGYQNYADMSMETKMAANVENVHSMIACLLGKAKEAQEQELESLQTFAETRGFEEDLSVFDVPFYKRKQMRSMIGLQDDDLRDFFPLPRVVTGVFQLCEEIFDIRFEEEKDPKNVNTWNPDVKLFKVIDSSSKVLGQFYFDPYIRDDKGYSGSDKGWYIPIRPKSKEILPLGAMIFSYPTPGYGKPSLLNFAEVREFLRNVGNMLIHMMSDVEWSDFSGRTGIEWDAIDVTSNFMAQWLYTPDFLTQLSGHWSSNENLAPKIIDSLCVSNHHLAGYDLCNELFKAAYDITFFSEDSGNESHEEMAMRLHKQYLLLPMEKDDSFPANFSEIIGGEKSAAYYSDTWAKMLAADAFSAVQEVGLQNKSEVKKVTKRFRNTFLSMGSSVPAAEVFRQFRGRDPSHEALLLSLGLKQRSKPKMKGQQEQQ